MRATDFLDTLPFNPDTVIRDMHKGLINQNFFLEMNQETYVLCIPRVDSEYIVNRYYEMVALEVVRDVDIDTETIYYDEANDYKVTRYLPDAGTYRECEDPYKLGWTAALVRRFHSLQKRVDTDFEPICRLQGYRNHPWQPLYDLIPYEDAIQAAYYLSNSRVLCHNDWADGNTLFIKDRTYPIDFEYTANNDPLFDVMPLLSKGQIENPALRECFYIMCSGEMNAIVHRQLNIWENSQNLLWCCWTMMMWENRHESVYHVIVRDKYEALRRKDPNI